MFKCNKMCCYVFTQPSNTFLIYETPSLCMVGGRQEVNRANGFYVPSRFSGYGDMNQHLPLMALTLKKFYTARWYQLEVENVSGSAVRAVFSCNGSEWELMSYNEGSSSSSLISCLFAAQGGYKDFSGSCLLTTLGPPAFPHIFKVALYPSNQFCYL